MSATLASILKELKSDLKIEFFESLDKVAGESSDGWNNAGTGHAALCELNYTPMGENGSVNISKALEINEAFEVSKQFWAYLVGKGVIKSPRDFINQVPHMSFVRGQADCDYLRKRFDALSDHHLFSEMEYSEDAATLREWMPLVMENRDPKEKIAATRVEAGTDVNFGALTRILIDDVCKHDDVHLHLGHRVTGLKRQKNSRWRVTAQDSKGKKRTVSARFVFIGAGGGTLPLLQKSGIPEGQGFGGFPVSGQFLRCDVPEIVEKHHAKVYGKASVGAPPMSVPHLDTRIIDGRKSLLFGPYAGFSTRFLKHGSLFDLPMSLKPDNLIPMLAAGRDNMDLTQYLIGQVLQSPEARMVTLREFVPTAHSKDWTLEIAGQRVQIIKKSQARGGILQFGTEVVAAEDGSMSALLGASPGASTAVPIMINLIRRCFRDEAADWTDKIREMIPSDGASLIENKQLFDKVRPWTNQALGLTQDLADPVH